MRAPRPSGRLGGLDSVVLFVLVLMLLRGRMVMMSAVVMARMSPFRGVPNCGDAMMGVRVGRWDGDVVLGPQGGTHGRVLRATG